MQCLGIQEEESRRRRRHGSPPAWPQQTAAPPPSHLSRSGIRHHRCCRCRRRSQVSVQGHPRRPHQPELRRVAALARAKPAAVVRRHVQQRSVAGHLPARPGPPFSSLSPDPRNRCPRPIPGTKSPSSFRYSFYSILAREIESNLVLFRVVMFL